MVPISNFYTSVLSWQNFPDDLKRCQSLMLAAKELRDSLTIQTNFLTDFAELVSHIKEKHIKSHMARASLPLGITNTDAVALALMADLRWHTSVLSKWASTVAPPQKKAEIISNVEYFQKDVMRFADKVQKIIDDYQKATALLEELLRNVTEMEEKAAEELARGNASLASGYSMSVAISKRDIARVLDERDKGLEKLRLNTLSLYITNIVQQFDVIKTDMKTIEQYMQERINGKPWDNYKNTVRKVQVMTNTACTILLCDRPFKVF